MPTSAIGNNPRWMKNAGFTLVEVMLTLAVVAAASAAIVLSIPGDRKALRQEVETFASTLTAARDAAILSNRMLIGYVNTGGYRFAAADKQPLPLALEEGRWDEATQVLIAPAGRTALQLSTLGDVTQARIDFRRGTAALSVQISENGAVRVLADG
ncbi:MAG: GspH/FimT family pseudopilin [Sphingomonadales bacterium]